MKTTLLTNNGKGLHSKQEDLFLLIIKIRLCISANQQWLNVNNSKYF
jgi:hypothetical protein